MEQVDGSITSEHDGYTDEQKLFTYSESEKQQQEIDSNNAKLVFSPKFIPMYPELLKRGLTLTEAMIFGFIDFYKSSSSHRFYFTNEQIAEIVQCHPDSVNRAISKLVSEGYIKTSRKIKAGGGQVRFVTDILYYSELTISTSLNRQNLLGNNNKINNNKINKNKYIAKDKPLRNISLNEKNINPFIELFKPLNLSYEVLFKNKTEREASLRMLDKHGFDKLKDVLKYYIQLKENNATYLVGIYKPTQLESKLSPLIDALKRNKKLLVEIQNEN